MKKAFVLLLIGLFLFVIPPHTSCTNRKIKLQKELYGLYSYGINIPFTSMDTITIDTINNPQRAQFQILIFLDSTECTPCSANQHQEWESFLKEYKRINSSITLTFIIEQKSVAEKIQRAYKRSYFEKSVLLDKNEEFRRKNSYFPESHMEHILLLNNKGKVLVVGNPIKNWKIHDLYLKHIKESTQKKINK